MIGVMVAVAVGIVLSNVFMYGWRKAYRKVHMLRLRRRWAREDARREWEDVEMVERMWAERDLRTQPNGFHIHPWFPAGMERLRELRAEFQAEQEQADAELADEEAVRYQLRYDPWTPAAIVEGDGVLEEELRHAEVVDEVEVR